MRREFLFFILCIGQIAAGYSQVNVHDGFETPELSELWSKDRLVDSSLRVQSAIVRSGHSALKVTLNSSNVFEAGRGGNRDSERDELREANKLVSAEGVDYEFKFSLFLQDSFPIVPIRLIIAQWKQYCHAGICDDDSPVLAIRYVSSRLHITIQTDSSTTTAWQTKDEIRNKWRTLHSTSVFQNPATER